MSTSSDKNSTQKMAFYGYLALLLMACVNLYEFFSHQVYSQVMRMVWLYPILGGLVMIGLFERWMVFRTISLYLWKMAMFTLSIGHILFGIFEIYGSETNIVYLYFFMGGLLVLVSIVLLCIKPKDPLL